MCALDLDPQKVGQELRVGRLLPGHFMKQGDTLTVTLEAIDVPDRPAAVADHRHVRKPRI